jgi:endonuclease/exonuclease/phosphatase family metal-dependent hydrolase
MKAKKNLFFIDRIILWLNYLLCIALLISYLAPFTDPKKSWVIPFFGLAYPLLFVASVAFIIYWVFRRKLYALLSIMCILCGWSVLRSNIGLHRGGGDAALKDGKVIRMMTYNVHNFKRYGSKNDISTKHDILQIIKDEQPDVMGFQEFYTRYKGEYDIRDSIIRIMNTNYYYFQPVIFNVTEGIGLALFSKYPIIDHGFVPFTFKPTENSCIYIDVKKGSQVFRIYSIHLQSIRFDPEDYKYLNNIAKQDSKPEGSSFWRVGGKLKTAFLKRSEQVVTVKEHAAKCPYPYIISGDFNDTPSSYAVNQMSKGLKNTFREKGFGFGRTYNGDFPNYQIDYIMASPQFDVNNYQITEKKLSDHYPVRSDLVLRSTTN